VLGDQAAAAAQTSHASPGIVTQQQNEHVQSGQSVEGSQQASQQPAAQQANTASQPQQTEQLAGLNRAADQQQAGTINLEFPDGSNTGEMAAAILSALSNQERDSTDHLASGSASTGSVSSIVVRTSFPIYSAFSLLYVSRELPSACHTTLHKSSADSPYGFKISMWQHA